jgi:hypothetical protein
LKSFIKLLIDFASRKRKESLIFVGNLENKFCFKNFAFEFMAIIFSETFIDFFSFFIKKGNLIHKDSIIPENLKDITVCLDKSSFTS